MCAVAWQVHETVIGAAIDARRQESVKAEQSAQVQLMVKQMQACLSAILPTCVLP